MATATWSSMFGRKKKVVSEPNPWLQIPHPHNWLNANDGKELVCGDCSLRRPNDGSALPKENVIVEK